MSIKNFFVRGEKLKHGINGVKHAAYLINKNHPSHSNTKIVEIWNDCDTWMENTIRSVAIHNERKAFGKGGRPTTTLGHSFVFSLPKGSEKPSISQWKLILKSIYSSLSKSCKVNIKNLVDNSYIVLHDQDNPHIHILICGVTENKTINQFLSNKNTMERLKSAFNNSCLSTLKLNNKTYTPNTYHSEKIEKIKYQENLTRNAENQLRKLLSAITNSDLKQYRRQVNRLKITIEKLQIENPEASNNIRKKLNKLTMEI